jgi:hypothetical protein
MYPTLAKAGAPGRLSPVATDLTVPRMRPTIRPPGPDVSATCHVEIKQTISGAWGEKATHYQQRKFNTQHNHRLAR